MLPVKVTEQELSGQFKDEIESAGYRFVLYANLNWLNNYLDMNALSDCEVWIARYRDFNRGHGYTGGGKVTMWQYTSTGPGKWHLG